MYNIDDVYQQVERLEEQNDSLKKSLDGILSKLNEMEQQLNWLRSEEEVKRHWQQGPTEMINR